MQLAIMEFFQHISSPQLDTAMQYITMLGEETLFIIATCTCLWAMSKHRGFVLFSTLFTALIGTGILKATIRAPRPFQVIAEIEGKRLATATGYSFPSGHTTGAAAFYSALGRTIGRKWISAVCAAIILLVGISRMYLGVHWPIDVFGGLALGITVTFVTTRWYASLFTRKARLAKFCAAVGIISSTSALLLAILLETGIADPVGFTDLLKLMSLSSGGYLGFLWEERHIRYSTAGSRTTKLVRVLAGIGVILAIQGLKAILPDLYISTVFRYASIGLWITALYPFLGTRIRIGTTTLFTRES
jgi:undecaprenyl-diphosphatase